MADFDEELLKSRLNDRLKLTHFKADYDHVKVLLLYWAGSTQEHLEFRDEGRRLGKFFTERFNFPVEEHPIPFELSQLSLQNRIINEVLAASRPTQTSGKTSLLIIHYGGHGDTDEDPESRAVWAGSANPQEGESLIHWYKVQETFEESKADILLLLDCCFSAQAGRARKRSGRIEILTASAKREETPLPGPKSFTSALIKVMTEFMEIDRHVTISNLHAQLLKRKVDLYGTPVNISIGPGHPDRSIRLSPLGGSTPVTSEQDLSGPSIRLLIRTTDLSNDNINDLVSWLRSDLPENVSLEVEGIVKQTVTIQRLVNDIPDRSQPLMRNLGNSTIEDIIATWSSISDLYSYYKSRRINLQDPKLLETQSLKFVNQLDHQNMEIIEAVEQGLLQSPNMEKELKLDEVIQDPLATSLGISDQLRLLQMIHFPRDFAADDPGSSSGVTGQEDVTSWKEFKKYGRYLDPKDVPLVESRVILLAELLNASKSSAFRSLRCLRWYHDKLDHQFVLEFDVPAAYKHDPKNFDGLSLKKIITDITGPDRPSLGQRLHIGYAIAKAVRQWHSVGWVHQSISSHNVIFFKGECGIDYEAPFLQGFDFARPNVGPSIGRYADDINHNVYRHPDRQGPARRGHTKTHDLYSLGVTLLEIGLWEHASITAGVKKGKDLTVDKMYRNLTKAAITRLAHYAGKDYQEAVLTCLKSEFGVKEDDESGSQLAKSVQRKVLDKLDKGSILR